MKRKVVVSCLLMPTLAAVLLACTTKQTSQETSLKGMWSAEELGGTPIMVEAADERPTLSLDPARKEVGGSTGCNHYFGKLTYDARKKTIAFSNMGVTQRLCPDGKTERQFLNALANTAGYTMTNDRLMLRAANGDVLIVFRKQP